MRRRQQTSLRPATALCVALIACGPPAPNAGGGGGAGGDLGAQCLDLTGDGACDLELDPACLGGENAASDPERQEACILMALANQDRQLFVEESAHAQELVWDERLWEVAKGHVEDMCARNYFEHETPEGLSPTDRANALGYDFSVAENIVVSGNSYLSHFLWMDEPTCTGHRGNILNPKNQRVGIAVIRCMEGRWSGMLMGVQNFHMNHAVQESDYCMRGETACEMPPDPITRAAAYCTNCTPNGPEMLPEWGCPDD